MGRKGGWITCLSSVQNNPLPIFLPYFFIFTSTAKAKRVPDAPHHQQRVPNIFLLPKNGLLAKPPFSPLLGATMS